MVQKKKQKKPPKSIASRKPSTPKSQSPKSTKIWDEAQNSQVSSDLVIVAIGASAGGLEALQALLPTLPKRDNLTYVVAQHLDPKHPSMLTSLLTRHTGLKVLEVQDGIEPKPGTIYITPPDCNVVVSEGRLLLTKPTNLLGPKPSIDLLLTTLGEDRGEKSVGIILSGTGTDGAHGITAVKANGGITIAEKPESAKYDGMPRAAIDTGHVDLVMNPQEIGENLLGVLVYPTRIPHLAREADAPSVMQSLMSLLNTRTGCDFSEYKQNTILRRIGRRMTVHKIKNLSDYVHLVEQDHQELDALYKDILISVTGFFRDPQSFTALKSVLKNILKSKKNRETVRIWIPGCASGEEAYTIAILLSEAQEENKIFLPIQIFATDIDSEALGRARKGLYSETALTMVDKKLLNRYFSRIDHSFRVNKSIREMVVFSRQDLVKDPPFSHLDLISCRNVLIYFSSTLQQKILPMFHYVLQPSGYLFLGKSESVGQFVDLFSPVDQKKAKIFRCRGELKTRRRDYALGRLPLLSHKHVTGVENIKQEIPLAEVANRVLMDAYGPPAIVVNDQLEVLHVRGDVSTYLSLPEGDTILNVLRMVRPEIRTDLRALLTKAGKDFKSVRSRELKLRHSQAQDPFHLFIQPIVGYGREGTKLVAFEPVVSQASTLSLPPPLQEEEISETRIRELQNELNVTQEHLHTTVEELETANEELQSVNEELQSANEELQSSNEELETANEELQSTNEELNTLNEELQERSAELSAANTDLENIQHAIGFAMLVVDKDLNLTRFTPHAKSIFTITQESIGHNLSTMPCKLQFPTLRDDIEEVMNQGRAKSRELVNHGKVYLFQCVPYYSQDQRPIGAILTFIDISEDKRAERALRESEERFRQIAENITEVFWITDKTGKRVEYVSPAYEKIWGRSCKSLYESGMDWMNTIHPDDQLRVQQYWKETVPGGKHRDIDYRILLPDGSERWIRDRGWPIFDETGEIIRFVCLAEDISQLKEVTRLIQEQESQCRLVMDHCPALIGSFNEDLRFQMVNNQFLDWVGRSLEKVENKHFQDVLGDETYRELKPKIEQALAGQHITFELKLSKKDEEKRWVQMTFVPDKTKQDKTKGFFFLIVDIHVLKEQYSS